MTLYYAPLESYPERYTWQWSRAETGWVERNWRSAGIDYVRIDSTVTPHPEIKIGCALDAIGRSLHCFSQVSQLLLLAEEGNLTSRDTIYFDDFWHPGFEALPYTFQLLGITPKMFAFLHAQSVDEFDFTYPMRDWMRPIEKGFAQALSGIFVSSSYLRDLLIQGGVTSPDKIHVTGFPIHSGEVLSRMPCMPAERSNHVVFSSRWDSEKNPLFFLAVAKEILRRRSDDIKFIVCTGAKRIRSNDPKVLEALHAACREYPNNIILKEGLTKEQYYAELCLAKVQMNTADQDFVSITLLETALAGCYPVYPYFRSFPEVFHHKPRFMYERLNLAHAVETVLKVLDQDNLWTPEAIESRAWLYRQFDISWLRMLDAMGLCPAHLRHKVVGRSPYEAQS